MGENYGKYAYPVRETVEKLRREYPSGTRVRLVSTADPCPDTKPGDTGTVNFVDNTGSVFISFDNGSLLGIQYGLDEIQKI